MQGITNAHSLFLLLVDVHRSAEAELLGKEETLLCIHRIGWSFVQDWLGEVSVIETSGLWLGGQDG